MQRIWEKDFPLRVYEVGSEGQTSLPTLMNFFQDAASEHATHLEAGFSQLAPRGLSWFATRYHVLVMRYPVYGETVRVKTWPKAKRRLFAIRDFEMFAGDEQIAVGSTVWCLVDLASRKPLDVRETLPDLPENPQDALASDLPRVSLPKLFDLEEVFSPRDSEIDMNGHANNTALISRALECLPHSGVKDHAVSGMVVFFKNETGIGQTILSQTSIVQKESSLESLHCLTIRGTKTEVLRMMLEWEKKESL